ncbi:MAG: ATP synthase F0 subunit B [Deltaproteobacteria bacterium]|nr:MAG: ATP synthase F0 subunit B [Deltaproteobacteria bacterium]
MIIRLTGKGLRLFLVSFVVITLVGGLVLSAFAAEDRQDTGSFKKYWMQTWQVLNFLILAFFLVKLLKEPLMRFFRQRSGTIREQLEGAEAASLEAERELQDLERRFETLEEEIQNLQQAIDEQAEKERDKIIASAKRTAEQILDKARLESAILVREARRRLRREIVDQAVSSAEESIRKAITSGDQERLVGDYLLELKDVAGLRT